MKTFTVEIDGLSLEIERDDDGKFIIPDGWRGIGSALKPANEPICLARKALSESTIARNLARWGVGALNIDKCRVGTPIDATPGGLHRGSGSTVGSFTGEHNISAIPVARWPANIILSDSEEVRAAFPETSASSASSGRNGKDIGDVFSLKRSEDGVRGHNDSGGSAARFYYSAKADADDRLGSKHPTVKPVDLIQYLVRLVTPKGGTTLDCFSGTGTTGEAAFREGCKAILIEREVEYQADIARRMALCMAGPDERARESIKARHGDVHPGPLFGGLMDEEQDSTRGVHGMGLGKDGGSHAAGDKSSRATRFGDAAE